MDACSNKLAEENCHFADFSDFFSDFIKLSCDPEVYTIKHEQSQMKHALLLIIALSFLAFGFAQSEWIPQAVTPHAHLHASKKRSEEKVRQAPATTIQNRTKSKLHTEGIDPKKKAVPPKAVDKCRHSDA